MLLKWVGYDETESTWEPEENMQLPQLSLDCFEVDKTENRRKFQSRNTGAKKGKMHSPALGRPVKSRSEESTASKESDHPPNTVK